MGIDEHLRIDRIHHDGQTPDAADQNADPTKFQKLLDELRAVAEKRPEEVADLEQLRQNVERADDDFQTLMEFRRLLESAYKKSQQ